MDDLEITKLLKTLSDKEDEAKAAYKAEEPGYEQARKKGYWQAMHRAHSEVLKWAMDLMPEKRDWEPKTHTDDRLRVIFGDPDGKLSDRCKECAYSTKIENWLAEDCQLFKKRV